MRQFASDREAEEFFIKLLTSETWKFIEEIIHDSEERVWHELNNPELRENGRALLHGKLITLKWLANLPRTISSHYVPTGQAAQEGKFDSDETIIHKPSDPEIITTFPDFCFSICFTAS